MTNTTNSHRVRVLVRLSPEDIRTIRTALQELLQIYGRAEGYGRIRHALAGLPSHADLAQLELDDQLHALAGACRDAGVRGGDQQASVLPANCSAYDVPPAGTVVLPSRARVTLPVPKPACRADGAVALEQILQRTPGVLRAYVSPATEMAYVEYDPAQIELAALERLIQSNAVGTDTSGAPA